MEGEDRPDVRELQLQLLKLVSA
eukprot:gene18585-biopygen5525